MFKTIEEVKRIEEYVKNHNVGKTPLVRPSSRLVRFILNLKGYTVYVARGAWLIGK